MAVAVRQDDVRRQNQFSILSVLRRHGPLSRTAMSALTGLSASTVTVITTSLMERGVLSDQHQDLATTNKRGRPQVLLAPNGTFATVVVLRLARGVAEGAAYDYAGAQLAWLESRRQTLSLTGEGLAAFLAGIIDQLVGDIEGARRSLTSIVIAIEGIVDGQGREVTSTPVADVHDVPLAGLLEDIFGARVEILNDCSSVAEALSWRAPERYGENFAAVLLSRGVGMGLMLHGRMFTGQKSSAMEFGHMIYKPGGALCRCGRRGCIEAYASIYSLWRAANGHDPDVLTEDEPPESTIAELVAKARLADGPERQALKEAGTALGTGLVNLFALFDSVPLVLTGPGTVALEFMMDEIEKAFTNRSFGLEAKPDIIDVYPDAAQLMREGGLMRALMAIDLGIPDHGESVFEVNNRVGRSIV